VLCAGCARAVAPAEGLLPDHVTATAPAGEPRGWLVDAWGRPHPLGVRATVGRRPEVGITVLSGSVSRDHAELSEASGGWQLRDLGSRNGTEIDGVRVQGRAPLADGATVRFGDVSFLFRDGSVAMPSIEHGSVETVQAGGGAAIRYAIAGDEIELVLLGASPTDATGGPAGALLYRAVGAASWSETTLPPLEFGLLELLCAQAVAEADSPSQARGCVATKHLARTLPFQSRYANEENVRQVVRRVRRNLEKLGVTGMVDSIPGRGYYLAWPVSRS
jgi:pSer/pThr/pTyr-binding forkhead associated (FHA) protein